MAWWQDVSICLLYNNQYSRDVTRGGFTRQDAM